MLSLNWIKRNINCWNFRRFQRPSGFDNKINISIETGWIKLQSAFCKYGDELPDLIIKATMRLMRAVGKLIAIIVRQITPFVMIAILPYVFMSPFCRFCFPEMIVLPKNDISTIEKHSHFMYNFPKAFSTGICRNSGWMKNNSNSLGFSVARFPNSWYYNNGNLATDNLVCEL